MNHKISKFVFKHRRFFHPATAAVPIFFKFYFHGSTTLLLLIVGFMLMVGGIAFRMYSASYLWGTHTTTTIKADFICTSGPFAYVRNPLYLGNFIIGLSLCIAFNEWYGYIAFIVHSISVYSILIPYEERFMQEKFGYAYAEYSAHSRRFLPRLNGYKGGTKVTPNYKLGILSEKYYFIILVIILIIFYMLFVK